MISLRVTTILLEKISKKYLNKAPRIIISSVLTVMTILKK